MSTHNLHFTPAPAPHDPNVVSARLGVGGEAFLNAMLEIPDAMHERRSPLKMAASVVVHGALIAALLIVPVYFAKNTLTLEKLTPTYVFTPPMPAPPPPMAAAAHAPQAPQVTPKISMPTLTAPRVVPQHTSDSSADNMAAPDLSAGVMGGVPGGVAGGVLGGVLGGTGAVPGPPAPVNTPSIVRVGGNVKAPVLVQHVQPEYPVVAKAAHVQGTVVIDAVIDKTGKVVSEHAVSGPNLLVAAALDAVQQWKYQPTYLNGQAVDLAMEVTVSFNLGAGA
jgi:protein TonB